MKNVLVATPLCFAALLGLATRASAAERGYSVTDFDRIRIEGPYKVTLVTGRSPGVRAFGSQAAVEALMVDLQGRTLIVRRNSQGWGGYPGQSAGSVELRVSTYGLRSAALNGVGSLNIDKVKGQALELSVAGSGLLKVGALEVDRLTLGVTGSGRAEIAGKALAAQVGVRGTGVIDAGSLVATDAKIAIEGPGDVRIGALRTANVVAHGAGSVTVLGQPACTIKATGSGSVTCGKSSEQR